MADTSSAVSMPDLLLRSSGVATQISPYEFENQATEVRKQASAPYRPKEQIREREIFPGPRNSPPAQGQYPLWVKSTSRQVQADVRSTAKQRA